MERQRTRQHSEGSSPDEGAPTAPGGGNVARQARGYGNAARRARSRCQSGAEAEKQLHKRRNRSGQ